MSLDPSMFGSSGSVTAAAFPNTRSIYPITAAESYHMIIAAQIWIMCTMWVISCHSVIGWISCGVTTNHGLCFTRLLVRWPSHAFLKERILWEAAVVFGSVSPWGLTFTSIDTQKLIIYPIIAPSTCAFPFVLKEHSPHTLTSTYRSLL